MESLLKSLSASTVIYGVLASIAAYIVIGSCVNYLKLRQFNGPRLAGFSRLWMFWQTVNARLNRANASALEKYGSVCRIGPDILATNDPDIHRHISAPRSKWRRSKWYDSVKFDPRLDTVFSTKDEGLHAELKAKEAGGYNGRDIDNLEPDIDACTTEFVELIKSKYEAKPMDVAETVRFYVLDVLSTVAYGKAYGFMAANTDLWNFGKLAGDFVAIVELSGSHKFFNRILSSSLVQALVQPKETDTIGMGPAVKHARKAVAERFGPDAKVHKDLLGHFVSKGLDQLQCEVEAFLQIVAGQDSTVTVIRCGLYTLAGNPASYANLRAEIDTAYESGDASLPVIKYTEALKMPYLNACVWEILRMFPPAFGLKSKVAPPEGDTIKGIFFPGGVEVTVVDDAVCRNRSIFGDDVNVFRPERWLEASPETRTRYERTVDTIFGSGRFMCLGRYIAMMKIYKSIVMLLRNFDLSIADPIKGVPTWAHGVWIQSEMNMIARSRSHNTTTTEDSQ